MNLLRPARWILLALLLLSFSAASMGQVFISVRIGPPALPVYVQPICPGPGYIWTPGYWAWDDDGGYYWVPGTWVVAPVGMLWTPGYWGWSDGFYIWHGGYWGPHVGFYGGINYGFGYTGTGFWGGYWERDRFYYNRSVTNVNVTNITNVYNKTVIVNNRTNVSYNGGRGGVMARPAPQELSAERERHQAPLSTQMQHQQEASRNRQLFARENHGRPAIAATARPADFRGRDVVAAKAAGAAYHPPAMSPREARRPSNAGNRPFTPANSNNAKQPANRPSQPSPRDNARSNGSRSNETRPNETRPNETRPKEGFRPFTPPSSNSHSSKSSSPQPADRPFTPPAKNSGNQRPSNNPVYQDKGHSGNNPVYEQRGSSRESALRPQHESRPQQEPRPQHESRPAPAPREAAPQPSHHESAPPPRQEKPSHEPEHHPNKGR